MSRLKTCNYCGELKTIDEFHKGKNRCKSCRSTLENESNKIRMQKNYKKDEAGVYLLFYIYDGEKYVYTGSTKQIHNRKIKHLSALRKGKSTPKLQVLFDKVERQFGLEEAENRLYMELVTPVDKVFLNGKEVYNVLMTSEQFIYEDLIKELNELGLNPDKYILNLKPPIKTIYNSKTLPMLNN